MSPMNQKRRLLTALDFVKPFWTHSPVSGSGEMSPLIWGNEFPEMSVPDQLSPIYSGESCDNWKIIL